MQYAIKFEHCCDNEHYRVFHCNVEADVASVDSLSLIYFFYVNALTVGAER